MAANQHIERTYRRASFSEVGANRPVGCSGYFIERNHLELRKKEFELTEIRFSAPACGDAIAKLGQRDSGEEDLTVTVGIHVFQNSFIPRLTVKKIDADVGVKNEAGHEKSRVC